MEKGDKGSTLIRMVWVGECFFWYRHTRVVPDQRPLNGRCCCCCLQCFDTVGWAAEGHPACKKLLLTNKDVSLIMRGRLYSSCVRSSMLHGSVTWPVRKENVVALQRAEMRMVRWMCGSKLKDRLPSKELRVRLVIDDIALVLQQNRLLWYGHVLRKDDGWVKKCMQYEVEGPRPRVRPKRTWREVVREDCQARNMNKVDAIDRCKWRKMIKDVRWSGWVWVGECFFWYRPTRVVPDQRPSNVCVCVYWEKHSNHSPIQHSSQWSFYSSQKSWALLRCFGAAQRPPQSARPPVSAKKVASHLVQVAKAPANEAFGRKVRDRWHQAHQNFATDPRPQAGEVVSALGEWN